MPADPSAASPCGRALRASKAHHSRARRRGVFDTRPVCPPASTQRLASCMAPASREPHGPRGTVRGPRRIGACDRPHPSAPVPLARFAPPAYPHGTGRVWHRFRGGGFKGVSCGRLLPIKRSSGSFQAANARSHAKGRGGWRSASPLAGEDTKSRSWRSQVVDFVGEGRLLAGMALIPSLGISSAKLSTSLRAASRSALRSLKSTSSISGLWPPLRSLPRQGGDGSPALSRPHFPLILGLVPGIQQRDVHRARDSVPLGVILKGQHLSPPRRAVAGSLAQGRG
jgi:hypothetical protein